MMKPRVLVLLLAAVVAISNFGVAKAADDPATTVVPTTSSDVATDSAPLTLDQEQIDALTAAADESEGDRSVFEKASDFVTDNAPWFIIGIIVLAAIISGILIMRGRPRKSKGGAGDGSGSKREMRQAGGSAGQPAQAPSSAELRRRKRAAVQRSREEERARRKAGIESRKTSRQGGVPVATPAAAAGGIAAGAGVAGGGLDPVEAEKQSARDQATAAGAVARYDAIEAPLAEPQVSQMPAPGNPPAEPSATRTVPAPVSPSQTAPAAGVVTPMAAAESGLPDDRSLDEAGGFEPDAGTTGEQLTPDPDDTFFEPAPASDYESPSAPEAETSILHEPSLENPGPDATVGNAAEAFLAGGAAGAAGGLAAAQASRSGDPEPGPAESLEPVIAPEPGMAAEYAVAEPVPVEPPVERPAEDTAAADAEARLRAKVAEIKASQPPLAGRFSTPPDHEPEPSPEPAPLGPGADLSPGLAAVERRLSENSTERDRALRDAEERLRRVEQRAEDAERRAAFAERLAQLKVEESEREKRLNDVVSGIDRAEQRAREAEARAEAAERAAAAALEQTDLKEPLPPASQESGPAVPEPQASNLADGDAEAAAGQAKPVESRAPDRPAVAPVQESAGPARKGIFGDSTPAGSGSEVVNLNGATFEQLREAGLSVTQATRILAYRERFGGYGSVDDLEKVPGFPKDLIESLRGRVTI